MLGEREAGVDWDEVASELHGRMGGASRQRGRPVWLRVRRRRAAVEAEELDRSAGWLGCHLEAGWSAAAVVSGGRLRPLHPGQELPAHLLAGQAGGLTLCCVVPRRGPMGWKLVLDGRGGLEEPPQQGFLLDVLRRAAGRPTGRPEPVGLYHLLWWVGTILAVGSCASRRLDWPAVRALNPMTSAQDVTSAPVGPPADLSRGCSTWEDLRLRAAGGKVEPWFPPPDLAAWMDEGMFSRWVLSGLPPVATLLCRCRPLLTPSAYHQLRRTGHVLAGCTLSGPDRR
jgi:hypothetical protein